MIHKVGDFVGILGGRDKIRYGTIEEIRLDKPFPYTIKIDDSTTIYSKRDDVLVSKELTIDNITPNGVYSLPDFPENEAIKHDTTKNRLELIPPEAIEAMGEAMTYGANKYSADNWSNGFEYRRLIGAALRHINAFNSGEDLDPESGLSHISHGLACLAMLSAHIQGGLGNDDRRKRNK